MRAVPFCIPPEAAASADIGTHRGRERDDLPRP